MPDQSKKHYSKQIGRPGRLDRDKFIDDSSLMKKGTSMRSQINLYWKKRAAEKKRYFKKLI